MGNPQGWQRYLVAQKRSGERVDAGMARFAARFALANATTGIELEGLKAAAQAGYSAALRVGMAYSALEALDTATGHSKRVTPVVSEQIARRFRDPKLSKLHSILVTELDAPRLVGSIEALLEAEGAADVAPVAAGIRHLFFHGDLSAYGAGLAQSATARKLLLELADATLAAADAGFTEYLDLNAVGATADQLLASCPDCGCARGERHQRDCEIAFCKGHGYRLAQCYQPGRHGTTVFRGVLPGTMEAIRHDWFVKQGGRNRPDLNRIITSLTWDPRSELYR